MRGPTDTNLHENPRNVQYNGRMRFAPLISRKVKCRPDAPWFNDELRRAKQELRSLERKTFSPNGIEVDRQIYRRKCHQYSNDLTAAKKKYHTEQLKDSSSRELFGKVEQMTRPRSSNSLPSNKGSTIPFSERFLRYFTDNVDNITKDLPSGPEDLDKYIKEKQTSFSFTRLRPATEDDVSKLITRSTSATCSLDPIPTQFVKMFRKELIHVITFAINESFDNGCFPDKFKCANICPKLKGTKNDPEEMKNYRPIANLKFFFA